MAQFKWYFEDMVLGQTIPVGSKTVTAEEIHAFAEAFDPQSFHIDPAAAAKSIYGGVIASGWHTCAMMMRPVVDGLMCDASSMGSPGVDAVRWMLPVRAGDTLTLSYRTTGVKASTSKPDRGVVRSIWIATNQHGQQVCTIEGMGMFARRPDA